MPTFSKKIKSFSHGEFNQNKFINEKKIQEKISKNEDIFERGFDLKKIDIDETYPGYIRRNKNILNEWIA